MNVKNNNIYIFVNNITIILSSNVLPYKLNNPTNK